MSHLALKVRIREVIKMVIFSNAEPDEDKKKEIEKEIAEKLAVEEQWNKYNPYRPDKQRLAKTRKAKEENEDLSKWEEL